MSVQRATLHQLKIFCAFGQHLSMARVARELHLTPSAVSIQIKQLSETLGQPLYEQVGKKLYLTEAGRVLCAGGREVFQRMERLDLDLAELRGLERGSLKVSVITSASNILPQLVGKFLKAHPSMVASLESCNREGILERFEKNLDDLYIMGQAPENMKVVSVPFLVNPLVMVAPVDHPLARQRGIDPGVVAREPFILRESGSGTRLATEKFFESHGVSLNVRLVLGSDEAVRQAVASGLGLAVMSRHILERDRPAGVFTELDVRGFPLTRHWYAVYPAGRSLSLIARSFLDFLEAEGESSPSTGAAKKAKRRPRKAAGAD
ncbi:MAG: LysR substrate-binding domain-containing protein [Deltaproteobacteria bacterium]|nr:LysR substrate-binding domain-containing protein [Deltaproteobacteria bacterium]